MRQAVFLLLAVAGLAVGGTFAARRLSRPVPPPPPPVPAEWADPPLVALGNARRQAVLDAPRSAAAWGELGLAFHAHARGDEAAACYRTAGDLDPADGRWPYFQATLLRAADPVAAADLVRTALAGKLPDADHATAAKLALADLLAETGRPAEAEAIGREVLTAAPNNLRAAYRLAVLAVDRGDDAAAKSLLRNTARNPFAQQHAAGLLAGIQRRAGNPKEAAGYEYAASLLPPDRPWPDPFLTPLGPLLRGRQALVQTITQAEGEGRFADAADTARTLVAEYPAPPNRLLLGRNLVSAGRLDEGVTVLADALRDDAGLVMAHAFTGIGELQLGQRAEGAFGKPAAEGHYRRAAESLQRATELKPDYAVGFLYRGRALAALGRPDEAVTAVQQFIDRRPEEWEGHATLAELLAAVGRKPEAVAAAERAVKVARPDDPRPRKLLDQLKK